MKIIMLPFKVKRPILACGADLKGAFALAKGDKAYLFDGFGDLSELDNLTRYEKAVKAAEKRLNIKPQVIVSDLHPDYFSTQFARHKNRDTSHFSGTCAGRKMGCVPILIEKNINSPMTSSMGRLFDAVGSLVLNKKNSTFEAELPIELEKIVDKNEYGHYDFELKKGDGPISIDMSRTIKGILKDLDKKIPKPRVSAKFHNTIAEMILKIAKISKMKRVVLSGGVFQNRYLKESSMKLLKNNGFKVYAHSNVETNDSGIPIGQIAIAIENNNGDVSL